MLYFLPSSSNTALPEEHPKLQHRPGATSRLQLPPDTLKGGCGTFTLLRPSFVLAGRCLETDPRGEAGSEQHREENGRQGREKGERREREGSGPGSPLPSPGCGGTPRPRPSEPAKACASPRSAPTHRVSSATFRTKSEVLGGRR